MKAIWKGTVVAQSEDIVIVEGNAYFPFDSVKKEYLVESATQSVCPWKGRALYYSLCVNGMLNTDAAWYYPKPKEAANKVLNRIAFWRGVQIVDE